MEAPNDSPPAPEMERWRRWVMIVGFLALVLLGVANIGRKNPLSELAFLVGAVAYFVWLARWTRWK